MNKMCYFCMQETVQNGRCTSCGRRASEHGSQERQDVLPPGTLLDHGNIIVGESLGCGGFGITYIARDRSKYDLIALKEFYPRSIARREGTNVVTMSEDGETYGRYMSDFKREVKHLLNLQGHPNIVKVFFGLEDENNTFYYGMELLQGESLRALIQRKKRMDPLEAFQLLEPIFDALSYAHAHQTLHRDVAPDNIYLRRNAKDPAHPSPCLIDFGAAFTDKNGVTYVAPAVKKRGFSPPDQGLPYAQQGPFIDVYALTATYYNMVTGCIPPPAMDRERISLKAASCYNAKVSKELDRAISKGMELNHEKRYQTVEDLRKALKSALSIGSKRSSFVVEKLYGEFWRTLGLGIKTAALTCTEGTMKGCEFLLDKTPLFLGREAELKIVDADRIASRKHCKVTFENGNWYIEDLRSHNGTWVNSKKIPAGQKMQLLPGAVLNIGREEFRFSYKG